MGIVKCVEAQVSCTHRLCSTSDLCNVYDQIKKNVVPEAACLPAGRGFKHVLSACLDRSGEKVKGSLVPAFPKYHRHGAQSGISS